MLYTLHFTQKLKAWGDYGDILANGMSKYLRDSGTLCLKRTGPFVPPLTFPGLDGAVVVRSDLKELITASELTGIGYFREVVIEKVTYVPWDTWDFKNKLDSRQLPENREPSDYILRGDHDSTLAEKMGPLFDWLPDRIGEVDRSGDKARVCGVRNLARDCFRINAKFFDRIYVSDLTKQLIETFAGDWVRFQPVPDGEFYS